MAELNANIIYDSSPYTERLIKFSMFYFDKVDLHFPDMCAAMIQNAPRNMPEFEIFAKSGNEIIGLINIFNFYDTAVIEFFERLSSISNVEINRFVRGRVIPHYTTQLLAVPDGKGRLVYNRDTTKYEQNDSPWVRLSRQNKEKKESTIMKIIEKNIQESIFKGTLHTGENGFELEADKTGRIHLDSDILSVFENACNDSVIQFLYQYYGEYVFKYEELKIYTWFQEYYFTVLSYIFNVLAGADNVVISDGILNNILSDAINSNSTKAKTKYFADKHIFQILLPDFFELGYDEIYELKQYASDELMALKHYICSLGTIESAKESEYIIQTKVNPSVKELESKITNMRIGITQKAIREIRTPVAYLPLLSSLVTNVDQKLAMAISLGVMGADLALEYYKEKRNIKSHPLFFKVDLNKKIQDVLL